MQRLEARSARRRLPRWAWVVLAVVLVAVVGAGAYALGRNNAPASSGSGTPNSGQAVHDRAATGGRHTTHGRTLAVASSVPANGATGVGSDGTITITFTDQVTLGSAQPQIAPAVAGTWRQADRHSIEFIPAAAMVPFTKETVTVPAGPTGMRADDGSTLAAPAAIAFTIADGSVTRLQQLLAGLNYLPVAFTPSGPAPVPTQVTQDQPGTFTWRWPGLPSELTSLWTPGYVDAITKGAIMSFETQNGMAVDGLAGPEVWASILSAAATGKVDPSPYAYVLVSKVLPENLTLYDNGVAKFTGIPVNTGAPGADTTDGTYQVFEHVIASEMKGTNPDGSKYDDPNVPWASYFNGGDALHGFVRASYGFPQSNGCVEMTIANAGMLWPFTPIGTLVTVIGPAS